MQTYDTNGKLLVTSGIVWKDTPEIAWSVDNGSAFDWTDLDLTAYTSATAKIAILCLQFTMGDTGTAGATDFSLRKNGTTDTTYFWRTSYTAPDWQSLTANLLLGLDTGQVMERKITFATGASALYASITVYGYVE